MIRRLGLLLVLCALPSAVWAQTVPRPGQGASSGGSLPAGGTVGQVVVNTGPGAGSWQDPKVSIWDSTLTNTVVPANSAPAGSAYGLPVRGIAEVDSSGTEINDSTTHAKKVVIRGNAGGIMDAAGQNAASPANELLVGAQFNTNPTPISSGNVSPLQVDNAGNLLVNIKVGGAGTSMADAGTFTQSTTSFTPAGCEYNSSVTNLSSGQAGAFSCTAARSLHVTMDNGSTTVTQARGLAAGDASVAEVAAWLYGMAPSGAGIALQATSSGALLISNPIATMAGTPTTLQPGVLMMGAVTQNPPIYQPGAAAPLPLTVTGAVPIAVQNPSTSATDNGSVTGGESNTAVVLSKGLVFDGGSWRRGSQSSRTLSAATTNQTSVKASPGVIYHIDCFNTSGATEFVKFYNTSGTPTAGSGTPVITFACPANNGHVADLTEGDVGDFTSGIGFTMVKLLADSDATAVGANDLVLHIWYR